MIRKYDKIVCILLLTILLTGCWDYKDINDRTIGITAGIDIVNDDIELAGEKVKLWSSSSGEGSMNNNKTETYKFKASGNTFENMRENYYTIIPAPDFAQSTISFVISKRYAEKREIESYMNRTYFSPGFRSSVDVSVTKEPMDELFSKKIENAISIGYGIESTMRYLNDEGKAIRKSVQEIQSDINFGSIGYLLPYVTVENNTVKYLGFAAMVDSKLAGIVKQEESNGFLLLISKKAGDTRVISSPSNDKTLLSIATKLKKREIRTTYEDNKINIYIDLKLKSVMQYQYHIEPLSKSNEDIKKEEEIIANQIKEDVLSAINRSQREFKSDVLGFARYFKAENSKIYKTINWKEEYPKAVFHVNVNTTIVGTELLDPNGKKPK